jgi:hypothetical protein
MIRVLAAGLLAIASLSFAPGMARAAASVQALTAANSSVAGNESEDFSARFLDAQGKPAVGETVRFSNDACGVFPNGTFNYSTTTDANGVAGARFTAFAQGITCHVTATDGAVQARFYVVTYLPAFVDIVAQIPPRILPGKSYDITASVMYGSFKLPNVDVAARIVPGTSTASIDPQGNATGSDGSTTFTVTPAAKVGDYRIELQFRDRVKDYAPAALETPWQDLWWAGLGENGWGMSVVQHRDTLFAVIYAYDAAGSPTWYVMSSGTWNAAHTVFTGALFHPLGAPFPAYDATRFDVGGPVGQASLDFTDPSSAVLSYAIDGVSGRKSISRNPFGPVDLSASLTVGDMWWGGVAQNGWGLAILQQYRTLFAVWFTYDANGQPAWYVMPSGHWTDAQTWEGRIYRATSSAWLGAAYDPAQFHTTDLGPFRLHFDAQAGTGTFDYTVGARSGSIPIQRTPF